MVLAISNVLRVPLILFTFIENLSVVTITPRVDVSGGEPILLAFNQFGNGHYDPVVLVSHPNIDVIDNGESAESAPLGDTMSKQCRCGRGRDRKYREKIPCTNKQMDDNNKTRASKCVCLKNKRSCENCQCINCGNPYGKRHTGGQEKQKRKRVNHNTQQVTKRTQLDFL